MAPPNTILDVAAAVTVAVAGVTLFIWLSNYLDRLATRKLALLYSQFDCRYVPRASDVVVRYDTYHGFLVSLTHTPHYFALPCEDAKRLLGQLFLFNLRYGFFAYGVLLVPIVAALNFVLQRRSIALQHAALSHNQALLEQPVPLDDNPYAASATMAIVRQPVRPMSSAHPPSIILKIGGVILLVVSTIASIGALAAAFHSRSYEPLMGACGGLFVASMGWKLYKHGS